MAQQVRTRREIWSLESEQEWHPITRAYSLAVEELQGRDPSSPTSWAYQATIHAMPDFGQPDSFRGQCQHFSWYFLPWHRLYLYWFEQLVLSVVTAHPEVDDDTKATWALPYWDYTPGGEHARLPEPFRVPKRPDAPDQENRLFNASRYPWINNGDALDPRSTTADAAYDQPTFSLPRPAGGFGGAATGFNNTNQDANAQAGALEGTPHGTVHSDVGGDMGQFPTAGLDPIFWLHHANLDRLWLVWLAKGGGRRDPSENAWTSMAFHFHDPAGAPVDNTVADALDTQASLGYKYDNVEPPPSARRRAERLVPMEPPPDHPAELVGATDQTLELAGSAQRVTFPVGRPTGPASKRGAADPARVYLTVEGLEAERNPGVNYAVYVNLPADAEPETDDDERLLPYYAGALTFFGIERSRNVDSDPGGHALTHSFDITRLVSAQRDAGIGDPEEPSVTFAPIKPRSRRRRGGAEADEPHTPVTVGRVGVYVQ